MNKRYLLHLLPCLLSLLPLTFLVAQTNSSSSDTKKNKFINIYSIYEPNLLNLYSKENFAFSNEPLESNPMQMEYKYDNIPSIVLNKPELKDALPAKDYSINDHEVYYDNMVKAGYGNNNSPYALLNLNLGNKKSFSSNLFGKFESAQGSLSNQEFYDLETGLTTTLRVNDINIKFKGYVENISRYLYGYDHNTISYSNAESKNTMTLIKGGIEVFNAKNILGNTFSYNPSFTFSFNQITPDENLYKQTQEIINNIELPLVFQFNKKLSFELYNQLILGDYTSAKANSRSYVVEYLHLKSLLQFSNNNDFSFGVQGMAGLVTDGTDTKPITQVKFFTHFLDRKFNIALLWNQTYIRNSMESIFKYNPYSDKVYDLKHTFLQELGAQFSFTSSRESIRVFFGHRNYENLMLFNQNELDSRFYSISYAEPLNALYGEISFSFIKNARFYNTLELKGHIFYDTDTKNFNKNIWGFIPLEVTHFLKWKLGNAFWIGSDLKIISGVTTGFEDGKGLRKQSNAAFDLSLNFEYKVIPMLSIWLEGSNLLNQTYQRWMDYPVIGITARGGIIFYFNIKSRKFLNTLH